MISKLSDDELILRERRRADKVFRFRRSIDFVYLALRSCAVCTSFLPPVDLLCESCWIEFGRLMNRGAALKQENTVFPTYSLLTWTPQNQHFVKPLIYGFKGGRTVRAAAKLATLFLSERFLFEQSLAHKKGSEFVVPAASDQFDHSWLWARQIADLLLSQEWPLLKDKEQGSGRQKQLRQGERGRRRSLVKEHFAKHAELAKVAKRIVFADDVITSGSTAMAAFMALGDPDHFEVWTIVARPRLAAKSSFC